MKKLLIITSVISGFVISPGCDGVKDVANNLGVVEDSTELYYPNIVSGLKTALKVSTDTAVNRLGVPDGFYKNDLLKLQMPPEADRVLENIKSIPLAEEMVNRTVLAINRAAEDAVKEAAPIFKDAITNLRFDDALEILNGSDTAATNYLRTTTYNDLRNAFKPKVEESLSKPFVLNTSAEKLYEILVEQHNKYSFDGRAYPRISETSLAEYTTNKALTGLFVKVAEEENRIRNNLSHQVTDTLRMIFKP